MEVFFEDQIVKMIMDLTNYYEDFIFEYEKNPIRDHFIEINDSNGYPLKYDLDEFIDDEDKNALLILGEYGCGKTSFCLDLTYRLMNEFKKDCNNYIPILIHLREYSKSISMDEMITDFFINKYSIINGNIRNFKKLLQYGKVLLIFDGFDEVAKRVDYDVKYKVFNEICKYASNNTKILLTCRPNYFQNNKEYENIFKESYLDFEPMDYKEVEFDEVFIGELNQEQIIKFVKTFKNELGLRNIKIQEFRDIINKTHDLLDLAKRPFLLNLIVKTLPLIIEQTKKLVGTKQEIQINAADLYENYTDQWLRREDSKGKTLIKASEKKLFCENLALKMFINDDNSISYKNLPEAITNYFENLTNITDIDYFSHDIKSCSFLCADGDGKFSFIHKSFMEFFVANIIVEKLYKIHLSVKNSSKKLSDDKIIQLIEDFLGENHISTEICLFISDLFEKKIIEKNNIITLIKSYIEELNDIATYNCISILAKAGVNVGDILLGLVISRNGIINLDGIDLSYALIKDVALYGISFDNASFYKAKIENVKFKKSSFINSSFQKAELESVNLSYQCLDNTDLAYAKVINCDMRGTSLANSRLVDTIIRECDFLDAEFSNMILKGNSKLIGCDNLESVIGLPYQI